MTGKAFKENSPIDDAHYSSMCKYTRSILQNLAQLINERATCTYNIGEKRFVIDDDQFEVVLVFVTANKMQFRANAHEKYRALPQLLVVCGIDNLFGGAFK